MNTHTIYLLVALAFVLGFGVGAVLAGMATHGTEVALRGYLVRRELDRRAHAEFEHPTPAPTFDDPTVVRLHDRRLGKTRPAVPVHRPTPALSVPTRQVSVRRVAAVTAGRRSE